MTFRLSPLRQNQLRKPSYCEMRKFCLVPNLRHSEMAFAMLPGDRSVPFTLDSELNRRYCCINAFRTNRKKNLNPSPSHIQRSLSRQRGPDFCMADSLVPRMLLFGCRQSWARGCCPPSRHLCERSITLLQTPSLLEVPSAWQAMSSLTTSLWNSPDLSCSLLFIWSSL